MKQTAVEWLIKQMVQSTTMKGWIEIFDKAKEMEKQQSYSEEEVLEIIKKLYVEIGFQFTNEIKEWCSKQFKNK